MNHVIKRNGRHSSDILLFAMATGDPVYPSRLEHPRDSGERYADAARVLSDTAEKCIILLTLDATEPQYRRDLQEIARAALVDRVVVGAPLADHISVWVFAEEKDYPVLFSDPAIAAVAPTLERGIQAKNRQLGDPVVYVPSLGREIDSSMRGFTVDNEQFRQRISEIPGDEEGFYKSDAEETFYSSGIELVNRGFSEDEAIDFLTELYSATAGCYGG